MNGYRIRIAVAAALVAFGCTKLLAQLFLGNWQVLSAGQSDIAARGIWLLAIVLPEIAVGGALFSLAVVTTLMRRTGVSLSTRVILSGVGAAAGAGLVFFGADPTVMALRAIPWSSSFGYHLVSAIVAVAFLLAGVVVAVRLARSSRLTPAAA